MSRELEVKDSAELMALINEAEEKTIMIVSFEGGENNGSNS